jgi:hypothetical protein
MRSTSTVKVPASRLAEKVRERRAEAVAAHEDAVAEFTIQRKLTRAAVKDALRRALKVKEPELLLDRDYRGGRYVPTIQLDGLEWDEVASGPGTLDTGKFDRDLALLELAGDQDIAVRPDSDWMRYL